MGGFPAWWRPYSDAPGLLAHMNTKVVSGQHRDETCLIWLDDRGKETLSFSFVELWKRAGAVARAMRCDKHVASDDRVLLCLSPGPAIFVSFWACLRASIIAVPVYPPDPAKLEKAIDKLKLIRDDCDARLCCCDDSVSMLRHTTRLMYTWPSGLEWWNLESIALSVPAPGGDGAITLDGADTSDIAFLQFTSGSTGDPKGVMISFANVWHNVNDIAMPLEDHVIRLRSIPDFDPDKDRLTTVSWLPQYHDLGYVFCLMGLSKLTEPPPQAYLCPHQPLVPWGTSSQHVANLISAEPSTLAPGSERLPRTLTGLT